MFRVTVSENGLQICLSAELENVDKVDVETRRFLSENGLGKISFNAILVMRELVNNSVIHGCGEDPSKKVQFALGMTEDGVEMTVEDEGEGFDWEEAMATVPDLSASHGRGMMILNTYCNGITFNEKGNAVSVKFIKNGA